MGAHSLKSLISLLPHSLKARARDSVVDRWLERRKEEAAIASWLAECRPIPPPAAYKQRLIREVARANGARVLVETGTNFGNTLAACLGSFDAIFSIELSPELYELAVTRFARFREVQLRHGDSARELPGVLSELMQPALFWLDAHYSGEGTARGEVDSPVLTELESIARHSTQGHIVLVDDARLFTGANGYPHLGGLREAASWMFPEHVFGVEYDVIAITPHRRDLTTCEGL